MTAKGLPPSKLICAIRAARLSDVIAALNEGADLEERDIHGHAGLPLRTACFEGNLSIVRELLARGADPNATASDGASAPLRLALRREHHDIAALLIERGARSTTAQETQPDVPDIGTIAFPEETVAPAKPASPPDNLIEFTTGHFPSWQTETLPNGPSGEFGTATSALSADLLFLEDNEIPPIAWDAPAKPK